MRFHQKAAVSPESAINSAAIDFTGTQMHFLLQTPERMLYDY
jgi:hypothetical protein